MLKPQKRIIADELPATTVSKSVYDLPQRKNVIQIDLPVSTSKTINYEIDPRTQLEPDVKGTKFHGIDPEKPTKHGVFLQKSETEVIPLGMDKKSPPIQKPKQEKKSANQKKADAHMGNATKDALEAAKQVEQKAKKMAESIDAKQVQPGQLLIKVAMTNRREKPDLQITTPQSIIDAKNAKLNQSN